MDPHTKSSSTKGSSTPDPADAPQLTVSVRSWAHGVVLRPDGELDHSSAAPMRDALDDAVGTAPGRLVIDCGGLAFCDSTGLNLLLRAGLAAEAAGGSLVVAAPGPMVSRMLEITGAQGILRVYATVEEALADEELLGDAP